MQLSIRISFISDDLKRGCYGSEQPYFTLTDKPPSNRKHDSSKQTTEDESWTVETLPKNTPSSKESKAGMRRKVPNSSGLTYDVDDTDTIPVHHSASSKLCTLNMWILMVKLYTFHIVYR